MNGWTANMKISRRRKKCENRHEKLIRIFMKQLCKAKDLMTENFYSPEVCSFGYKL